MKRVVAFSGGKDSTAMLIRMLELDMPIDEIVFADTGFEFPELYEYIKRIEKYIGRKITVVNPKTTFKHWFYGKPTRGKHKGKMRGFPLIAYPCYWTREAKVRPLTALQKGADEVCIGIAFDEKERMSKVDGYLKYPLVEWKWTEKDCIDYLNKKDLFNPLYVNFDRLGCYFCPKQSEKSLYILWKCYPDLWEKMLWWDYETERVTKVVDMIFGFILELGHYIKGNVSLMELQKNFENGRVPKALPKYECWNGCEGVKRAFKEKQKIIKSTDQSLSPSRN